MDLGWVDIPFDLRIQFRCDSDYKGIYAHVGRVNGDIITNRELQFDDGTIKLGVFYNTGGVSKSNFYLNETPDGIYMVVRAGPATDHANDYQMQVGEGYLINKFQWLVMQKRLQKFTSLTIQDIVDTIPHMTSRQYTIKNAKLIPIVWGQGIRNRVKLVNDANPDGIIICADGNVLTPDVFDVLDTWSEKDQDLFLLKTFTNIL